MYVVLFLVKAHRICISKVDLICQSFSLSLKRKYMLDINGDQLKNHMELYPGYLEDHFNIHKLR